jgi:hypothetical protein
MAALASFGDVSNLESTLTDSFSMMVARRNAVFGDIKE